MRPLEGITVVTLEHAIAFGFGTRLCTHPTQVEVIHAACRPTAEAQVTLANGSAGERH